MNLGAIMLHTWFGPLLAQIVHLIFFLTLLLRISVQDFLFKTITFCLFFVFLSFFFFFFKIWPLFQSAKIECVFFSLQVLFYLQIYWHVFYRSICSINNDKCWTEIGTGQRGLQVDTDLLFSTLQEELFIPLQILPNTPPSSTNVSFLIMRLSSRNAVNYSVEIQMHSVYYISLLCWI